MMIIAVGIIIALGSVALSIGVAWLASRNQTSGAPVMGVLLLGAAGLALGLVLIGIGVVAG